MRGRPAHPRPRADVALMAGYHSPQVDVDVRLNTNESPVPPPDGVARRSWPRSCRRDRLAPLPRPRRRRAAGRPSAAHHGVEPEQVFAANGSNEVLQALCLAYGGPGARSPCSSRPTPCTPTSPGSPAPTWSWASATTTSPSTSTRSAASSAEHRPGDHLPVLAQQPDRAGRARGGRSARCSTRRPGWSSSTRPTASSPRGRRSTWSTRTTRSSSPAPSPRRGRWPALRLGYLRRPRRGWSTSSRRSRCRTTSTPFKQVAGRLALDHERRDAGPGRRRWSRSGAGCWPRLAGSTSTCGRRRANFVLFRPRRRPRRRGVGRAASSGRSSSATARRGPASTAACASPSAPATRRRRFLAALTEILEACVDEPHRQHAAAPPRRPTSRSRSTSTAPAGPRCRPGCRSSTTCSTSSAGTAASTSTVKATGDLAGRRPPHGRGRRHRPRRGVPRGARRQGRRRPLRQRAVPARRGAGRGRPRPVRAGRSSRATSRSARCCRWATRRSTRSWPSTSGSRSPRRGRHHPARHQAGRATTPTTWSRPRSRATARCLRAAVRVEGDGGVPSTKGAL